MDTLLITCANCGTANRVPRELDPARFDAFLSWLARELGA